MKEEFALSQDLAEISKNFVMVNLEVKLYCALFIINVLTVLKILNQLFFTG